MKVASVGANSEYYWHFNKNAWRYDRVANQHQGVNQLGGDKKAKKTDMLKNVGNGFEQHYESS